MLICKDARTVIAENQEKVCINLSGNDGMATAGSGDVLTGILLSVLAQRKGELLGAHVWEYISMGWPGIWQLRKRTCRYAGEGHCPGGSQYFK